MLVCPACRRDNPEEAQFCTFCGRTLAPEASVVGRSVRREDRTETFDIPVPKPPSPLAGGTTADAYRPQTEGAVVLVVAEEVDPGINTEAYAEVYRDNQEEGGLFPGPSRRVEIGGSGGVIWEITGTTDEGTSVRQRQLTVVRDGMGWVITFAGAADGFNEHRQFFDGMVQSWAWK